jgi:hypothetical protein
MLALRIEINGELIAVAGADNLAMLSGQIAYGVQSAGAVAMDSVVFSVMGLDVNSARPRQLTWANGVQLKMGDRVTFQLVEADNPTPPSEIRASPSSQELAAAAERDEESATRNSRDGA